MGTKQNDSLQPSSSRDMPCSLRSQLQRMFVPEAAFGLVSEDDLVVTSDVDTFVMRPDIFEELLEPQNLDKISILQVIFQHLCRPNKRMLLVTCVQSDIFCSFITILVRQYYRIRDHLRNGIHLNAILAVEGTTK